jgi:ATP-dependent Clp protease protease subunit
MTTEESRYELGMVEGGLLHQGIMQIFGPIDDYTHDYIQKCMTIMESNNSPNLIAKINSSGGGLTWSFAIHDLLKFYRGDTLGIVIGQACSGANLILQACKTRAASQGSVLLVHNMITTISMDVIRDKKEWRENLLRLEAWQNKIYRIYQERTGKSRKEIRKIFQDEEPLTAEKAKKLGLIDQIIEKMTFEVRPMAAGVTL